MTRSSQTFNHAATHSGHAGQDVAQVARTSIQMLWRNWKARRGVGRMHDFDACTPDDMGVRREEVEWATTLPFYANPALELERRSVERRRREFERTNRHPSFLYL